MNAETARRRARQFMRDAVNTERVHGYEAARALYDAATCAYLTAVSLTTPTPETR